jgi:hypothetical protein
MPSVSEPAGYVLEVLREGADFTLYRGRQPGNPTPVLMVADAAERPSPQGLKRLEHEYSLAAELDPAWAAKPLAISRHEGRTILILTDPGGKPLDLVLERDISANTESRFRAARQQDTRRRPEVVHWRTSTRRKPDGWRVSKRILAFFIILLGTTPPGRRC